MPASEQEQQFQAFEKDGRWPTAPSPAKRTLCLNAEPATLARALWDQLGKNQRHSFTTTWRPYSAAKKGIWSAAYVAALDGCRWNFE